MPIYEYRCQACGAELEKLQKISDPLLVECPECGQDSLVKLVSASSFRLKGGGWYESDFKTGNKKNGVGDADAKVEGTSTPDKGQAASDGAGSSTSAEGASSSKKEDAAKPAKAGPGVNPAATPKSPSA